MATVSKQAFVIGACGACLAVGLMGLSWLQGSRPIDKVVDAHTVDIESVSNAANVDLVELRPVGSEAELDDAGITDQPARPVPQADQQVETASARAEVELTKGNSIVVRVVDERGESVRGASVDLCDAADTWGSQRVSRLAKPRHVARSTETNAHGVATFEGVPNGAWLVWAGEPFSYYTSSDELVLEGDSSRVQCELILEAVPANQIITGRLLDAQGEGTFMPRVRLYWSKGNESKYEAAIRGDRRGEFILRLDEVVEDAVLVGKGVGLNYDQVVLEGVDGGARNLVLRLQPSADLFVDVRGPNGALTGRRSIKFRVKRAGHWVRFKNKTSRVSQALRPMPYPRPIETFTISVIHADFPVKEYGPYDPAEVGETIRIDLVPFAHVVGRVFVNGEPKPGIEVSLSGKYGKKITDKNGQFEFDRDSDQVEVVSVTHEFYGRAESTPVQLVSGSTVEANVFIGDVGSLVGEVLFPDGDLTNRSSTLFLYHNDSKQLARALIQDDGTFVVESIRSGIWSAGLTNPLSSREESIQRDPETGELDYSLVETPSLGSISVRVEETGKTEVVLDFRSEPECVLNGVVIVESDSLRSGLVSYRFGFREGDGVIRLLDLEDASLVALDSVARRHFRNECSRTRPISD